MFEEIWLINLDVIPGKKDHPATAEEKQAADEKSDQNFAALQKEFGNIVLPVYHQDSGKERLLEVIDQANGYMCLSPFNNKPEEERWRWATLARSTLSDLNCNVRTHGLATTGNDMLRHATLFSGDSEAWTRHARYGVVDLAEDQTTYVDCPNTHLSKNEGGEVVEMDRYLKVDQHEQLRYIGYHISAELNDWDRSSGDKIIDNARHFEHLKAEQRVSVRNREEQHVPFLLAQFDMRARSLVNLAELRAIAERRKWSEPTGPCVTATVDGNSANPALFAGESTRVSPRPSTIDRQRFLSRSEAYSSL
ncbi:MAG: hypothetical protein JXR15_13285 [Shimia sp.]|uniref:hypothetical protein n=1 Tax=Shimia sp. TaxID=1954381 RepID=UPI003B8C7E43